jgi:hypothetical protein
MAAAAATTSARRPAGCDANVSLASKAFSTSARQREDDCQRRHRFRRGIHRLLDRIDLREGCDESRQQRVRRGAMLRRGVGEPRERQGHHRLLEG